MPRPRRTRTGPVRPREPDSYFRLSTRPLYVLIFLLPLIAFYELGSALYLRTSGQAGAQIVEDIRAHGLLKLFFDVFGVGGFYIPGVALIAVLIVWHILRRDRWEIRLPILGGMFLESIAWSMPLLVVGQMAQRAIRGMFATAATGVDWAPAHALSSGAAGSRVFALAASSADRLVELSKPARATIAVGAGLYEELLFRMVAIAAVHFITADLLRVKEPYAKIVAVTIPAIAFAAHHDVWLAHGLDWPRFVFFFLAGLYLGVLYIFRGFGIVVAAHAMYDLVALLSK